MNNLYKERKSRKLLERDWDHMPPLPCPLPPLLSPSPPPPVATALQLYTDTYWEPCQTANKLSVVKYFCKSSNSDVWQGSEYASDI